MAEISRLRGSSAESGRDWIGWFAFAYLHIRLVVAIGTIFVLGSVVYALSADFTFTSNAILAPAKKINRAGGGLGAEANSLSPLAAVAGLGGISGNDAQRLASILSSRSFAENILLRHGGLQMLYPDDWDSAGGHWYGEKPNLDRAIKLFGNRFTATIDRATDFIKIELKARTPEQAQKMLNTIIRELNKRERQRALTQATENMEYIRQKLQNEHNADLRDALSAVAQSQLAQIMFATVQKDYAVEVIDPPYLPTTRSAPRRTLIVIVGTMLGAIAVLLTLIIIRFWPSTHKYISDVRTLAQQLKSDLT